MASSTCPANYYPGYPEHERARRGAALHLAPSEAGAIAVELRAWLKATRRFVDARSGGIQGRCFDDVAVTQQQR